MTLKMFFLYVCVHTDYVWMHVPVYAEARERGQLSSSLIPLSQYFPWTWSLSVFHQAESQKAFSNPPDPLLPHPADHGLQTHMDFKTWIVSTKLEDPCVYSEHSYPLCHLPSHWKSFLLSITSLWLNDLWLSVCLTVLSATRPILCSLLTAMSIVGILGYTI